MKRFLLPVLMILCSLATAADEPKSLEAQVKELTSKVESLEWELDRVRKISDDALFWLRLSDVAEIDKVLLAGPPDPNDKERYGISNERHPIRVYQYVFMPKNLDKAKKHPAIMLTHGGVHGDNVVEVEQLIVHLKAAGKSFDYKIYEDAPGGHSFERIDTTFARNVRKDMYAFLAKHLR